MKKLLPLLAMLLLALAPLSVRAADAAPDPTKIPALQPFLDQEGKAYYMGREAGIDGWFILMSGNRVQIAYTSLDGVNLIIGAILQPNNGNITEKQIIAVREREPEVNKLFTNTVEQAKAGMVKASGMDKLLAGLDPAKKGDQLYLELAQGITVNFGPKDAPLMFMVIDPNCPHCHDAWLALAPLLAKGNLQVRLIPVGILGNASEREAAMLLQDGDKSAALWQDYAKSGFDPDKLAGAPSEGATAKVQINRALFDRWNLKATPFIAYRSKAGGVKVLNATPKDMAAIVADIAPTPKAGITPVPAKK